MLSLLHIENIAIIESADISFDRGFNVLTGETGAGKSIVIDAISAVLGERTSREVIRTGAKSALVNAVFTGEVPLKWLEDNGFPADGEELMLQREIQGDGRNICRVNGRPLTVAQLRELGRQLLNIHGQHDGQQLLDEECHLGYLDSFGGTQDVLEAFSTAYAQVRELRRERDKLQMDDGEKARRMDTLTYQIEELEKAELREGEDEELSQRREVLRNAERLTDAVDGAWQALTGGEDGEGAVSLLMEAGNRLAQGGRYSEGLRELSEKAEQLRCDADDLAELVRDLRGTLDFYPGELDEIEERLDRLYRLKKKYGGTVAEMLAYLDRCREELDAIQFSEDRIARLDQELDKALLPVLADIFRCRIDDLFGRGDIMRKSAPDKVLDRCCGAVAEELGACSFRDIDRWEDYDRAMAEYRRGLKEDDHMRSAVMEGHGIAYYREKLGALLLRKPQEGWQELFKQEGLDEVLNLVGDEEFRKALEEICRSSLTFFTLRTLRSRCGIQEEASLKEKLEKSKLFEVFKSKQLL